MRIDRGRIKKIFSAYVSKYDLEDEKIRLKYEHTYRVADLCDHIAKSEGLCQDDIDLAWVCGMFHDIGRFEQVRRYQTFNDAESVDHAWLSTEVLFQDRIVEEFFDQITEDECEFLKKVIICHSAYRIPQEYSEREAMFSHILRDADKIDILKVNCDFALEDIYNVTTEQLMHDTVTKEVLDSFYRKEAVLRSLKRSSVDHIVGHISLTFELVYAESLKIVKQQGYLQKLLCVKTENEITRGQFEKMREFMNVYLAQ